MRQMHQNRKSAGETRSFHMSVRINGYPRKRQPGVYAKGTASASGSWVIRRRKKGGPPESPADQQSGFAEHEIREDVVPAVSFRPIIPAAGFSVPEFVGSRQRRIPLTPGFENRLQNARVKPVHEETVLYPFVALEPGTGVQLGKDQKADQEDKEHRIENRPCCGFRPEPQQTGPEHRQDGKIRQGNHVNQQPGPQTGRNKPASPPISIWPVKRHTKNTFSSTKIITCFMGLSASGTISTRHFCRLNTACLHLYIIKVNRVSIFFSIPPSKPPAGFSRPIPFFTGPSGRVRPGSYFTFFNCFYLS